MADKPKVYGNMTVDEIEEFDNLTALYTGAERTLSIAFNTANNRLATLELDKKEFWKRLGARLGFDPDDLDNPVKMERINGTMKVRALTGDEKTKGERGYY